MVKYDLYVVNQVSRNLWNSCPRRKIFLQTRFISMHLVRKENGKFKILLEMCNVLQDCTIVHNYFIYFIIDILYPPLTTGFLNNILKSYLH